MPQQDEARKDAVEMQAEEVRTGLSDVLDRVRHDRERVIITRYGKPIAALVPMSDFESLAPASAA